MLSWTELTCFLYILARMSGFVFFNPILGRKNIPKTLQTGLVMVLSVFVFSAMGHRGAVLPTTIAEFLLRVLLELLLGFFLGMVVQFFMFIPHFAGFLVDTQMGMTMNQIYDAGSQSNLSVTGEFLNLLMLLLFFAGNGHHTLLRVLITSGQIVPYGQIAIGPSAIDAMLGLFVECTLLALKLAMPILAAELVGQLGMGLLMKAIPQINVFSINIELKVIIGVLLLLLMIAPFSEFLLTAEMEMLDSMQSILALTAATG